MKILVFGAGGVGSVVGAFLARLGHDVSLLGRPWHLDVIEKQGLTVTGLWGDYHLKAFQLYRDPVEIKKRNAHFDLIILTVKSYDTAQAVEAIVPLVDERTTLLSLQNGLGNIETVLETIKPEKFLIGRVIFGVEIEPGAVKVTLIPEIGLAPASLTVTATALTKAVPTVVVCGVVPGLAVIALAAPAVFVREKLTVVSPVAAAVTV